MKILNYIPIFLIIWASCTQSQENTEEVPLAADSQGFITLSPEQIETIKLKVEKFSERNIANTVRANGYLDAPPQSKAVISPMITGYVRKVNFLLGDEVRQGEVMAELESIEYIDLQQQYMELKSNLVYLNEDFERQKLLREQDAVSMKKYLKAEVDLNVANSTLGALSSKLQLLGNNLEQLDQGRIQSKILLRAPISGNVNKLNVSIGKHVDPHEEIYELISTDHLHLELNVYERDVPKVKKGQEVRFRITSLGDRQFAGEVFLVGKDVSEEKRSINVHVHFNDTEDQFTVGMYGTANIAVDESRSHAISSKAVVVDGSQSYVFRRISGTTDQFEKIAVKAGTESDGFIEILNIDDFEADDEIVTDGAFYLLNVIEGV